MTWQGLPYMLFHLICKTTAEPHVENRRRDITRGANLQADKVSVFQFLGCEDVHGVMTDSKHNSDEQAPERLTD